MTATPAVLPDADIIVLDAHGVVFNRAFPAFVQRHSVVRGDDPDAVWERWRTTLRLDFWEGRTPEAAMWGALFPGDDPGLLSSEMERGFRPGPLFEVVAAGERRFWMLSNHRSEWLLPRLERFGLGGQFERVLVSDQLRVAKPHRRAFAPLVDAMQQASVCFIDDSVVNVAAARAIGIEACLPSSDPCAGDHGRSAPTRSPGPDPVARDA